MLHNWAIGASGSGKTALNKLLCAGLRRKGVKTVVLDPLRDDGWDADFVTHHTESFWRWLLTHPDDSVAIFLEEASFLDREDKRFNKAALTGRHAGWRLFLITQRYVGVHPDLRDMCKERWMFNCDADDAQRLYRTYGHEALRDLSNLPALHFYRARPMLPLQKGEIRFHRGRRPQLFLENLKAPVPVAR